MSNAYDLLVLTVPQVATEGKEQAKDKVDGIIAKQKGKILSSDDWGERFLTYPIKKYDRGVYMMYSVEIARSQVKPLDTKLSLESSVLRHLLIKKAKTKV